MALLAYDSQQTGFDAERFVAALVRSQSCDRRLCIETSRRIFVGLRFVKRDGIGLGGLETPAFVLHPELVYPAERYAIVETGLANTELELLAPVEFARRDRCSNRIDYAITRACDVLWLDIEHQEAILTLETTTQQARARLELVVGNWGAELYTSHLEAAYEVDAARVARLVAGRNRVVRVCVVEPESEPESEME